MLFLCHLRRIKTDLHGDPRDAENCCGQEHEAQYGQGQQDCEETACRDRKTPVQEEVLRISHRSCHAPKVRRHGLEHHDPGHMLLFTDHVQNKDCKGDKGQKCHIVGDQHGAEEGKHNQHPRELPEIILAGEQLPRHQDEETTLLKSGHHHHQAE